MGWQHYALLAVVLVAGYWLGTKYPGMLTKASGGMVTA